MVTNENYMLSTLKYWNQSLRLCSLSSLINKHLLKLQRFESLIKGRDTGCANNVSISQNFILGLSFEVFVSLLIFFAELTLLLFQGHEVLQSFELTVFEVLDLLMERNEVDV